ncbi:MAG: radical SAM family heme chaperone HemW [Candidatus Izimaplasma sp.]|nr:radical SAM family heme chaperone HemW [Candidatus Izimaplasma bacterium]
MTGLYLHIPFCKAICTYCDFVKTRAKPEKQHSYIQALIEEIEQNKTYIASIDTIYIGGGTPSSLSYSDLSKLFTSIQKTTDLSRVSEYTIECNPDDITPQLVQLMRDYGINRVSLGVESFDNHILKKMNRTHQKETIFKAIDILRKGDLNNISIDLIFAYPGQTLTSVLEDINYAVTLDVPHISSYSLILEEKTVLAYKVAQKQERIIDEETEALMYTKVIETLKTKGYRHYEISNFAKHGYASKHNLLYWTDQSYIGLGVGAHSYINHKRLMHTPNITSYINSQHNNFASVILEDVSNPLQDACMMGLRLIDGLYVPRIEATYNIQLFDQFPELHTVIKQGLLIYDDDYLKLTPKGQLFGNQVFAIFVEG